MMFFFVFNPETIPGLPENFFSSIKIFIIWHLIQALIFFTCGVFDIVRIIRFFNFTFKPYVGVVKEIHVDVPNRIFDRVIVYIVLEYEDESGKIKQITSESIRFKKIFRNKIDYYLNCKYYLPKLENGIKMKFYLTKQTIKKAVVWGECE